MAAEFAADPGEGTGLDEAIAAYLTACEVEGKTPRTVQAYAETLGPLPHGLQGVIPASVWTPRGISMATTY